MGRSRQQKRLSNNEKDIPTIMHKKIILIRHGKASMAGVDSQRELDEDGIIQASSLNKKLVHLGFTNATIYSSPFKRALQTIEPFINQNKGLTIDIRKELEEIHISKDSKLSKHEIIEKMWSDQDFKAGEGISQKDHFNMIENFLNDLFDKFKNENKDIIIITHGNLIGIILKFFFKINFGFIEWKKMTMPDIYLLKFDKNNNFIDMQRDNSDIEKIFSI